MKAMWVAVAAALAATPAFGQSSSTGTWNGLPRTLQIDTGYFHLSADTVLRLNGPNGGGGDVNFENDLGINPKVSTFWVDGTWHLGRRHQLKLSYTRVHRDRADYTLQRGFSWGGDDYSVGLSASTSTGADLLGGYYRFAIVKNDRFEIGPAVGFGYLWLNAGVSATGTVSGPGGGQSQTLDRSASIGSVTGAVGGYAQGWLTKRLTAQADFLYIKVKPENAEAAVTDWRLAADYYFFRNAGLGVQYKYYKYRYDRSALSSELGGKLKFQGVQVYLSFLL